MLSTCFSSWCVVQRAADVRNSGSVDAGFGAGGLVGAQLKEVSNHTRELLGTLL